MVVTAAEMLGCEVAPGAAVVVVAGFEVSAGVGAGAPIVVVAGAGFAAVGTVGAAVGGAPNRVMAASRRLGKCQTREGISTKRESGNLRFGASLVSLAVSLEAGAPPNRLKVGATMLSN